MKNMLFKKKKLQATLLDKIYHATNWMAVKLPSRQYPHSKTARKTQNQKFAILTVPSNFADITLLGGIIIQAANSWLGYKRSKAMTHAVEALYKNDKLSNNRLKILDTTTEIVTKRTSNYLQALKTRINRHDEGLNILARAMQSYLRAANDNFYKINNDTQ